MEIDIACDDFDVEFEDTPEAAPLARAQSLDSGMVAFNDIEFDVSLFEEGFGDDDSFNEEPVVDGHVYDYIMFLCE